MRLGLLTVCALALVGCASTDEPDPPPPTATTTSGFMADLKAAGISLDEPDAQVAGATICAEIPPRGERGAQLAAEREVGITGTYARQLVVASVRNLCPEYADQID